MEGESSVESVRLCPYCGHLNAGTGERRCDNCWLLLKEVAAIPRMDAEQQALGQARRIHRVRLVRPILAIALAIGLTVWGMLTFVDLGPSPNSATTDLSASVEPQTWALGRRTLENTAFTPDQAPIPQKIKWTYANPMPLLAAPAVVDDRIYLTTQDGLTVALDRQTGETVWEYRNGLPSSSTPAVAGDLVIFGLLPGVIIALDRETGSLRWQWSKRDGTSHIFSSPIVVNGTVYIGAGEILYAFDVETGQQLWAFPAKEWILSPVAYADDTVVVATRGSLIHIVDTETGHMRFVYNSGRSSDGPVINGNTAYFSSQGGIVWAIDRRAITYPIERAVWYWKFQLFIWNMLSDAPQQKGSIWGTRVDGDIMSNPAFAHDTVYVANVEGKVFALDGDTGGVRWSTDVGFKTTTAPTVAGKTVLIGTREGFVFGLDADTGEILWDFKAEGKITDSPIVVGDTMYVVADDGKLYAVTGAQ